MALSVAALASACLLTGGSCPGDLEGSAIGDYTLLSVDGESLPVSLGDLGELTSGRLELRDDFSVRLTLVYSTGTETDDGTWARGGATVTLTLDDTGLVFVTFVDATISWNRDEGVFLFQR